MTIKIQAYQKQGIKSDKIEDEFEFCCWEDLKKWLGRFPILYGCPKCSPKTNLTKPKENVNKENNS